MTAAALNVVGRLRARGRLSSAWFSCLVAAPVAVVFLLTYRPVFHTLTEQWATNDTYSFGVLIPFITAYLIWEARGRLRTASVEPSLGAGLAVVVPAAALLVAGRVTAIVAFQELSLVLMIVGLTLFLLGGQFLRRLWFPLLYLLLMLPIWEPLTDRLHYHAQLFSAALAEALLRWGSVPVLRNEVYLDLPNIRLEVAAACSGVNFLIAVIAVGIPQAYLYLRGWSARTAAVALAVAVAFLSNGLRVALIGALVHHGWTGAIHGPGHILQGVFVSSIGFVALLGGIRLLAIWYPHEPELVVHESNPRRLLHPARFVIASVAAALVLGGVSIADASSLMTRDSSYRPQPQLSDAWQALDATGARFISGPGAESERAQLFQTAAGQQISVYVGPLTVRAADGMTYRAVQLPAQIDSSQVLIGEEVGAPIRLNRAIFIEGRTLTSVIYWYDLDGYITPQSAIAKAYSFAQLLRGLPSTVSLVAVVASAEPDDRSVRQVSERFVLDVIKGMQPSERTLRPVAN
jgi:exosortase